MSREALSRIETTVNYIHDLPDTSSINIITTGGFAEYFNTSDKPHGILLNEKLIKSGVDAEHLLSHINSVGTILDAIGVLRAIYKGDMKLDKIPIVKNEFHCERVRRIFYKLFPHMKLNFLTDDLRGTPDQIKSEARQLKDLDWQLSDIGDIKCITDASLGGMLGELKHYDNLSYFALLGSFSILLFLYGVKSNIFGSFDLSTCFLAYCYL